MKNQQLPLSDSGSAESEPPPRNKGGRPKAEAPKVHIGFRLAHDLVQGIKATGPGYNARVEAVLRDALANGLLDPWPAAQAELWTAPPDR